MLRATSLKQPRLALPFPFPFPFLPLDELFEELLVSLDRESDVLPRCFPALRSPGGGATSRLDHESSSSRTSSSVPPLELLRALPLWRR